MFEKQTSEGRGLQPPLAQGMLKGACSPVLRGAQREPAQAVWGCWGDRAEGTCTVLALLWDIAALSLHPAESRASCSARVTCVQLYKTLLMYAVEISAAGNSPPARAAFHIRLHATRLPLWGCRAATPSTFCGFRCRHLWPYALG